jgi:hypothetical protein
MPVATTISRTELYQLIWTEPMTKVAPRFGLSDVGLAKVCKRYNIPRPPVGYWAQKQFGKQPTQTALPPEAENLQSIEFLAEEREKPSFKGPKIKERVSDEQLKRLIAHEEQPDNHIVVPGEVTKYHTIVRQTKVAFNDAYVDRGLSFPSWTSEGARLRIQVAQESVPRALRLMDTLIKTFEERGHKVVVTPTEQRKDVLFVILGEKFRFRLREKTRMVRLSEAERKKDYSYGRVKYEPTGLLELQLHSDQSSSMHATWKDGTQAKLEDQLNDVLIEITVAVEKEREWRVQQEEYARQRREAEAQRWRQEEERRKEQQKVQELNQMSENWERAGRIRAFMAEVRLRVERNKGPIEEGSELARWIKWALDHADRIDPLGSNPRVESDCGSAGDGAIPRKPR